MIRSRAFAALACLLLGCSSQGSGFAGEAPDSGGDGGGQNFGLDGSGGGKVEVVAHLKGTVRAPNGTIPIAGALVYLTHERPAPTPAKVYCDECVRLPANTPQALTDETGAYDLPATALGPQFVVIQKGGFRRVREIYVSKGDASLPDTLTTLPPKTDLAAGDEVPRMTVVHGAYDEIEASLQKLGIDPSAIEIVQSALIGQAATAFLKDAAKVDDRHIVFLPCGDFTQPPPNTDLSADKTIQDNLRAFVAAGGRLYVTDWHYDFIARTFPAFVDFAGASATACSGCGHLTYDAAATLSDPGLASWLGAQNLKSFTLQKNYTAIDRVNPLLDPTSATPKTITPHVWVSGSRDGGPVKPATVSFEHGCGRVLFSTYHTEPFSTTLTPQERALLGVLLEVNVCNASPSGVLK